LTATRKRHDRDYNIEDFQSINVKLATRHGVRRSIGPVSDAGCQRGCALLTIARGATLLHA
jgi:hypothetical protein